MNEINAQANFEAAKERQDSSLTMNDDASTNLFNSVIDELAITEGAAGGKNGVRSSDSSPLLNDDIPQAFRGTKDLEIVDSETGKSLTRPADEMPSSGKPAGATAEMSHHSSVTSDNQKTQNKLNDLLEAPSSGRPQGATPETRGGAVREYTRTSSTFNPRIETAREAQSSGRPAGATVESMPNREARSTGKPTGASAETQLRGGTHRGSPNNTFKYASDEVRSSGKPEGASAETQLRGSSSGTHRDRTDNTRKYNASDEVRSIGKPQGASAETQLRGTGNQNGTSDNRKQTEATKEAPSTKKPDGAVAESKRNLQNKDHRSSVSDIEQQNRGVEIQGRTRNERATEEKRTIGGFSSWADRENY